MATFLIYKYKVKRGADNSLGFIVLQFLCHTLMKYRSYSNKNIDVFIINSN